MYAVTHEKLNVRIGQWRSPKFVMEGFNIEASNARGGVSGGGVFLSENFRHLVTATLNFAAEIW